MVEHRTALPFRVLSISACIFLSALSRARAHGAPFFSPFFRTFLSRCGTHAFALFSSAFHALRWRMPLNSFFLSYTHSRGTSAAALYNHPSTTQLSIFNQSGANSGQKRKELKHCWGKRGGGREEPGKNTAGILHTTYRPSHLTFPACTHTWADMHLPCTPQGWTQ